MKRFRRLPYIAASLGLTCVVSCGSPHRWTTAPPEIVSPPPTKDFNLVWADNNLDPNGSPVDPAWAPQKDEQPTVPPRKTGPCQNKKTNAPYDKPCTDEETVIDGPDFPSNLICIPFSPSSKIHGHADWEVATYVGTLQWMNYAADWDFDFELFSDGQPGVTEDNHPEGSSAKKFIEIEFDSREVADRFSTPWWKKLANVARQNDKRKVAEVLNARDHYKPPLALVVGLFGLDCEHGCRSELHPVYALAIQVDDRPEANVWAIFVRNWGNGGFCSRYNHELETAGFLSLILPYNSPKLPMWSGTSFRFAASSTDTPPSFCYQEGRGIVVTLHLPQPEDRDIQELLLTVRWPKTAKSVPYGTSQQIEIPNQAEPPTTIQPKSAEEYVGAAFHGAGLSLQALNFQRDIFAPGVPNSMKKSELFKPPSTRLLESGPLEIGNCSAGEASPHIRVTRHRSRRLVEASSSFRSTATGPASTPSATTTVAAPLRLDPVKREWDKAVLRYLCSLYKSKGQGLPEYGNLNLKNLNKKICGSKKLAPNPNP